MKGCVSAKWIFLALKRPGKRSISSRSNNSKPGESKSKSKGSPMYFYYNVDQQNPARSKLISKVVPPVLVIKDLLSIQSHAINLANPHLIAIKVTILLLNPTQPITPSPHKALLESALNPPQPLLPHKIAQIQISLTLEIHPRKEITRIRVEVDHHL